MPSLQKKLRDLERTIKKNGSTPELEKRRKDLENEKNGKQKKEKEKKIAEKYHMVKFVERQKLVRKIRAVRVKIAEVSNNEEALSELQAKEESLMDDLCYVMYYPKDMKYIALFSKENDQPNNNTSASADNYQKSKDRIKSLKEIVLKVAKESRQKDIDAGYEDRVQHAIDVEFNTASSSPTNTNSSSNNNNSSSRIKSNKSHNNTNNESINITNAEKQRKRTRNDDHDIFPSTAKKSDIQHDIDDDDNTEELPKTKKSKLQKTNDANDDDTTTDNLNNDKVITAPISSPSFAKTKVIDPFFLEETPEGANVDPSTLKYVKPPQFRVSVGDIKKHAHSGKTRKIVVENDGTMTKQEMRLLNWQVKVRGNNQR